MKLLSQLDVITIPHNILSYLDQKCIVDNWRGADMRGADKNDSIEQCDKFI